jgi:site-specific recombinase XerD
VLQPRDTGTREQKVDYISLFMQSRRAIDASEGTVTFYRVKLGRFLTEVDPDKAKPHHIERFLLQFDNPGNRHAHFRVIRTFYRWREQTFGTPTPMKHMRAPKLGKLILPSLTRTQVLALIQSTDSLRNKAIIALATESGLRLTELVNIHPQDIDWQRHTIRVLGKGKKEAYAPFGALSQQYLSAWLAQHSPNGNIWTMNKWGVTTMLRRLEATTGLPCNPHTFRRTFVCLLRKAGVDTMTIKDLGRWESLEMVQRYTRSVTFEDSMKHYKAPLSSTSWDDPERGEARTRRESVRG